MAASIVPELLLKGDKNYANWSAWMKHYFIAHDDMWDDVIERSGDPPNPEENEVEYKAWKKKNSAALFAILISCSSSLLSEIRDMTSAKLCWDHLAQICKEESLLVSNLQPDQESDLQSIQESDLQPDENLDLQPDQESGIQPVQELGIQPVQESDLKPVQPDEELDLQTDDIQETKEDEFAKFLPLYKAIKRGDLDGVKSFLHLHQDAINQKITENGSTALHLATLQGNIKLVEELLELMSDGGVEITNNVERTALSIAAEIGATKIAELLVEKNEKLVSIPSGHHIPVITACCCGHKDTTLFLYSQTPTSLLLEDYGAWLFYSALHLEMLDIALDLIRQSPFLATRRINYYTPLIHFAGLPHLFPSGRQLVFWKRWIYSCIQVQLPTFPNNDVRVPIILQKGQMQHENCLAQVLFHQFQIMGSRFLSLFGIQQIYNLKLRHAYVLALIRHVSEAIYTLSASERKERGVHEAFFVAANFGIIEFVIAITKANPSLLDLLDQNSRNILQVVVRNRQEKIYNHIISALGARKQMLSSGDDCYGNNLLHLAAMIAPPNTLERLSGAALQMQRELQWYKEVESVVLPSLKQYNNVENLTPKKLFTKEHKELMAEGEKWMKETAQSSTVVGALIITIMFAVAFAVPGGNNQERGYPIFVHENSFKVFIISDAVSLFASSTSVITFLGVLTSRYAEEDFLISLPKKMIIGLSTLFISIAAMMVSFCATLIIMLHGNLNLIIPTVLLASIPVTIFMLLQFPLLVEIFISTYGPGIFNRKKKYF